MIRENLIQVRQRIRQAAQRAGRNEQEIELIVVTKNVPVERILQAYEAGERKFGENRVQELLVKQEQLPGDVEWHLIGHLQTNKVKSIIGRIHLIHSIDSSKLAQEIEERASRAVAVVHILVQVNGSGEASKFGISPKDFPALLEAMSSLRYVRVEGLMTMAPLTEDETKIRAAFKGLRLLKEEWVGKGFAHLKCLSMGMTHDYEIAVEEGANLLRIGTAIFGERRPLHAAA